MEAGRRLLSPPNLSRTYHHHHIPCPISSSVSTLHVQASQTATPMLTASVVRQFHVSVLPQEQRDDDETSYIIKDGKIVQVKLDRRHVEDGLLFYEEREKHDFNHYMKCIEHQLLYQLWFSYPFLLPYTEEKPMVSMSVKSGASDTCIVAHTEPTQMEQSISNLVRPGDVLSLARRAMVASRKAASLAEKLNSSHVEFDELHFLGLDPLGSTKGILMEDETTIRSKRLLERQSKKRKVPKKPNTDVYEVSSVFNRSVKKKIDKGLDPSDPLRLFLWGPETKQLLTVKEEKELFVKIQELTKLEEVRNKLKVQFNREPTLAEWAQVVAMSCRDLQSCVSSGKRSRDKMIYANFLLVVHVAKQYEGKGLNIQDLLQEGSRGLMKSLDKFKPKVGCRFPTYAYWWIRQSIKKAIYQHSRTIRLPENVFALLQRIKNARRLYIQEGCLPTNEDLAKRSGISVDKLESLLLTTRNPVSIQEHAWRDEGVTFQEMTADLEVETPALSVAKQMMRQHARNLLTVLTTRERQIIQLRFGIKDNRQRSLTEIGVLFGVSKERIRQLERRAMGKLQDCLTSQGLGAYEHLLI